MANIETTRFGTIKVDPEEILVFPEGMLGFSKLHEYVLIEQAEEPLFLWLQSMKKPSVAFPLLEPQIFELKYQVELEDEDKQTLQAANNTPLKAYCIITIPSDPSKMTANLKAPIVVNLKDRLAKQVILHKKDYPIRKSIYLELQQFCSHAQKPLFTGDRSDEAPSYQAIKINEELLELVS